MSSHVFRRCLRIYKHFLLSVLVEANDSEHGLWLDSGINCLKSVERFDFTWFHFTHAFTAFFPRTPRSAGSAQGYTQYEWTSPGSKPSSPFIALEKKKEALTERNKPRPGTAEAEIEGTFNSVFELEYLSSWINGKYFNPESLWAQFWIAVYNKKNCDFKPVSSLRSWRFCLSKWATKSQGEWGGNNDKPVFSVRACFPRVFRSFYSLPRNKPLAAQASQPQGWSQKEKRKN